MDPATISFNFETNTSTISARFDLKSFQTRLIILDLTFRSGNLVQKMHAIYNFSIFGMVMISMINFEMKQK